MKRILFAMLLAFAAALALRPVAAFAQDRSPFEGAWKGQLAANGSSQGILLFVFDDGDKTTGFVAMLDADKKEYELLNVLRQADKLTFEYGDPYDTGLLPRTKVELKPASAGLAGTWSDSRGRSGTVSLAREESGGPSVPDPGTLSQSGGPARPEDALAGTWTGVMVADGTSTEADLFLSVLDDGVWGLMTPDVEAAATSFEIGHAAFAGGTLTCDYTDTRGPQPVRVTLALRLSDPQRLEGTFRDALGKSGTLKLILKDKAPSAP